MPEAEFKYVEVPSHEDIDRAIKLVRAEFGFSIANGATTLAEAEEGEAGCEFVVNLLVCLKSFLGAWEVLQEADEVARETGNPPVSTEEVPYAR